MPSTNYILTSNGGFISEAELYHYGVKGMKWGVRKNAREFYDKRIQKERKKNKINYELDKFNDYIDATSRPENKLNKSIERAKKYRRNDTRLAWLQAKNKAKMDPSYKQSEEYKKPRKLTRWLPWKSH